MTEWVAVGFAFPLFICPTFNHNAFIFRGKPLLLQAQCMFLVGLSPAHLQEWAYDPGLAKETQH